jgi:hypothetical protein
MTTRQTALSAVQIMKINVYSIETMIYIIIKVMIVMAFAQVGVPALWLLPFRTVLHTRLPAWLEADARILQVMISLTKFLNN